MSSSRPDRIETEVLSVPPTSTNQDVEQIKPLLTALEALRVEPENESRFDQLIKSFVDLGPRQGAVLTYAPYASLLLSDDPSGF